MGIMLYIFWQNKIKRFVWKEAVGMYLTRAEKKQNMMDTILQLYVNQGLENTSMRDVAAALKINVSTLYGYFRSKEDMVIEVTKHYMEQLEEKFEEEHRHIAPDLKTEVQHIFRLLTGEKQSLRFIYQVVSSPLYGERGRRELEKIYSEYMKFSEMLAVAYHIDPDRFEEAFLLFVATVHDFCLWDTEEFVDKKMRCIYYLIDQEYKNKGNQHVSGQAI